MRGKWGRGGVSEGAGKWGEGVEVSDLGAGKVRRDNDVLGDCQ